MVGPWIPGMHYDRDANQLVPVLIRVKDKQRPISRSNMEIYKQYETLEQARMAADRLNWLRTGETNEG